MTNEVFTIPDGVRILKVGHGGYQVRYILCRDTFKISSKLTPPVRFGEVSRVIHADDRDSTVVRYKAFVVVTDIYKLFSYSPTSVSAAASAAAKKAGLPMMVAVVEGRNANVVSVKNAIRLTKVAKTSTKLDILKYVDFRETIVATLEAIDLSGENFLA